MDMQDEMRRFKFLLVGLVVFIVSAYFAVGELKYFLFGKTTEARLVQSFEESRAGGRRSVGRKQLVVEYLFTDTDGTVRKEADRVARDWPLDRSAPIPIQYIPGSPHASRLQGHTKTVFVYVFGASLVALAGFGVQFWRFYKS